ncbi:uncharacterized protein LOC129037185 [Pongo pygmaeus]|uniref:uncharacterized protein LOC129037185 n=1 Tax=Pongo pygmaeus TaxID=9600 RepID=UPI0023E313A7|nr:uncharacterized protein LOC129037185 [Pongo pygmaeus]
MTHDRVNDVTDAEQMPIVSQVWSCCPINQLISPDDPCRRLEHNTTVRKARCCPHAPRRNPPGARWYVGSVSPGDSDVAGIQVLPAAGHRALPRWITLAAAWTSLKMESFSEQVTWVAGAGIQPESGMSAGCHGACPRQILQELWTASCRGTWALFLPLQPVLGCRLLDGRGLEMPKLLPLLVLGARSSSRAQGGPLKKLTSTILEQQSTGHDVNLMKLVKGIQGDLDRAPSHTLQTEILP